MLDPTSLTPTNLALEQGKRLATTALSKQMKDRCLLMAKDYVLLTDIAEQEILAHVRYN